MDNPQEQSTRTQRIVDNAIGSAIGGVLVLLFAFLASALFGVVDGIPTRAVVGAGLVAAAIIVGLLAAWRTWVIGAGVWAWARYVAARRIALRHLREASAAHDRYQATLARLNDLDLLLATYGSVLDTTISGERPVSIERIREISHVMAEIRTSVAKLQAELPLVQTHALRISERAERACEQRERAARRATAWSRYMAQRFPRTLRPVE